MFSAVFAGLVKFSRSMDKTAIQVNKRFQKALRGRRNV